MLLSLIQDILDLHSVSPLGMVCFRTTSILPDSRAGGTSILLARNLSRLLGSCENGPHTGSSELPPLKKTFISFCGRTENYSMDPMTNNPQGQVITEIKIVRSPNRKRTVSARLTDGVMFVNAPAGISDKELDKLISKFKGRLLKKKLKKELNQQQDLKEIAEKLNRTYFDGRLKIGSIEYSANQNSRFGCCNIKTGKILISHRLAAMPEWVRDYVMVHELAHLIVPNHGRAFQELTAKYKLKERAIGFLMAKGYQEENADIHDSG